MFVTFEGTDGSGKSTMLSGVASLAASAGVEVVCTAEPGGTPLGDVLRDVLLHGCEPSPTAEALLFAAARSEHVERVILPALARGALVLCDRFSDSTFAYQSEQVPLELLRRIDVIATGGLTPDMTVLMVVPVSTTLSRISPRRDTDRIESRPESFHASVAERYARLSEDDPKRFFRADAATSASEVWGQIAARLGGSDL